LRGLLLTGRIRFWRSSNGIEKIIIINGLLTVVRKCDELKRFIDPVVPHSRRRFRYIRNDSESLCAKSCNQKFLLSP
jgi:hypothetical protein